MGKATRGIVTKANERVNIMHKDNNAQEEMRAIRRAREEAGPTNKGCTTWSTAMWTT